MRQLLLLGAPVAALVDRVAAEFFDFRALREPLLLMVGLGVLATSYAPTGERTVWRPLALTMALGMATWTLAISGYAVLHAARGGAFDFGPMADSPQLVQALGLIAAHGILLGGPTGLAAAVLLLVSGRRPRRTDATEPA
jgi:hypothetical protein